MALLYPHSLSRGARCGDILFTPGAVRTGEWLAGNGRQMNKELTEANSLTTRAPAALAAVIDPEQESTMNYRHLIAFFIPLAFALPATAAGWPEGAKTEFANECIAGAQASHSKELLQAFCECAAEQVSREVSAAELEAMRSQSQPNPALQQRLVTASSSCNAKLQG